MCIFVYVDIDVYILTHVCQFINTQINLCVYIHL